MGFHGRGAEEGGKGRDEAGGRVVQMQQRAEPLVSGSDWGGRQSCPDLVSSWKMPGALLPKKGPPCSVRVTLTLRVEYGAFLGSEMPWSDLGGP